tara:strand:+ start:31 stop:279 length:249 start_codon:yes stop_codon:yes gene_type:complete
MDCRLGCGACCIFIDISSSIPNHPNGKPAGVRCKNMNNNNVCDIYNTDEYPKVCQKYEAEKEFCGDTFEESEKILKQIMKLY